MRTPLRYIPVEFAGATSVPLGFTLARLGEEYKINYRSLIIRMITGNLDIRCESSNLLIEQRINYSILGNITPIVPDVNTIFSNMGVTKKSLYKLATTSDTKNRTFYAELFMEIARYHHMIKVENYILAFLHSYRILERISLVLPLIWASKAITYSGTYTSLKKYFNDDKSGEMKTLERFLGEFLDEAYMDTHCTFSLSSSNTSWNDRNFSLLKSILEDNKISTVSETPKTSLTLRYRNIIPLQIAIRNRYFHSLTGGEKNIGFDSCPDPDALFRDVTQTMTAWLMFIISQILIYEISN